MAPDPGTGFDVFLEKWEDRARLEDLSRELVTRRAQADSPMGSLKDPEPSSSRLPRDLAR